MATKKTGKKYEVELDWYYVSRETIGKWVVVFLAAAVMVVGIVWWYLKRDENVPGKAGREIEAAETVLARVRALPNAVRLRDDVGVVEQKIGEAKSRLASGKAAEALQAAVDARSLAQRLIDRGPDVGDAQIIESTGRVEIQRSGRSAWEAAASGMRLFEGDFLKTGPSGAAEVMAVDGTLYKIKPETLFEVHRTTQQPGAGPLNRRSEMKLITGVFDINTGESSQSVVKTDSATAQIDKSSRVGVDVDESKTTGVSAYQGSATVQTQGGQQLRLGGRERAVVASGGTGTKMLLPEAPGLLAPDANAAYDMRKKEPVALKWSKVAAAVRYRIQIARSRYFISDSIVADDSNRLKPEILVTAQNEGGYFWRVSTIGKSGVASEWSEIRRFRVLSGRAVEGTQADKTPPDLVLARPQVIGTLVIVSGRTEPGATVTVNGEPAEPDASGNFKKTISVQRDGFNSIVVKATDGAGNETERRENVLIQSS